MASRAISRRTGRTRKEHRARRVVDQDGHAGGGFESADISAFPADDAAFDFVSAGQGNGGGGFSKVCSPA